MDKAHSATRPFWVIEMEEYLVLFMGIFASVATLRWATKHAEPSITNFDKRMGFSPPFVDVVLEALAALIIFLLCKGLILAFKMWKTRRYPGSYCYCFERFEPSTGQKKAVVGYFILECLSDGSLSASGASFDWVSRHLQHDSVVRWSSDHVGTTEEQDKVKCFILYRVSAEDRARRSYSQGMLRFEAINDVGDSGGQAYRGTMQAIDPGASSAVYSEAYGERVGKKLSDQNLEGYVATHARFLYEKYRPSGE